MESSQIKEVTDKKLSEEQILELYRNISNTLSIIEQRNTEQNNSPQLENDNAWLYILFVLMFYAFSIIVLLVKYIRRERESAKLEYYFNEFVKRDWYKDKNLYDSCGRRLKYNSNGHKTIAQISPKSYYEDPEDLFDNSRDGSNSSISFDNEDSKKSKKKSVILCVGAASILTESALMGMKPLRQPREINLGARPKKSSMKKPMSRKNSNSSILNSNIKRSVSLRRCSTQEEFDTLPLPFLHNENKLILTKVDEQVRRVQSIPPSVRNKRLLVKSISQDSQESM